MTISVKCSHCGETHIAQELASPVQGFTHVVECPTGAGVIYVKHTKEPEFNKASAEARGFRFGV